MKKNQSLLFFLIILSCLQTAGQSMRTKDTVLVNQLLDKSKPLIATDSAAAYKLCMEARAKARAIHYYKGEAYALKNLGMIYYLRGRYLETLDYWNQSLDLFEKIKDDVGTSNMLNNIGAIYFNQGADAKALEYILKSLQIAERIGDTLRMMSALINVGTTYYNKKDPVALSYLLKVIPLIENNPNKEAYIVVTGDVGEIYSDNNEDAKALNYFNKSITAAGETSAAAFALNGLGKLKLKERNFSAALAYHNKALDLAKKGEDKLQIIRGLRGIADVYVKLNNIPLAITYYTRAKLDAEAMDDLKVELKDLYKAMAFVYSKNNDFSNAFSYQTLYSDIKDTLYNIEAKKKLNQLQFDFELSKKQAQIDLKEANLKSERQARWGLIAGLGLLGIIIFITYRNYLQKSRINKILDRQKDQIESLLLNILPKEVATELQNSGYSKPRYFNEVSVLFTDFKGFTTLADKMAPNELVEHLNIYFNTFDAIVEKYGLEKIKTIGDSYMCAGNLPLPVADHAIKIIEAALEIKYFVDKRNELRISEGLEPWEIRIGLHLGPVVAGVVGSKKYAYDIWGSTVNIASRMESSGVAGQVNISSTVYDKVKDHFDCIHRGKIYAKNIGEIDMYLVNNEFDLSKALTSPLLKDNPLTESLQ